MVAFIMILMNHNTKETKQGDIKHAPSVAGNSKGNKVTETTLQEAGIFITLADSGEIISQSPETRSESGNELYTPRWFM
jgi:hypothetical protein